ncbi:hypothetical protein [Flavobacterium sp. N1994]|uniref:hypothetical protein n=1 Tax=Flavobacterium sp. N1994 TaxID=2986827 RepID=UPI0022224851|nr:hypothetical protein [Flavobacterium sp. N1994]
MKQLKSTLIIISLLLIQSTFACECDSKGDFLKVANKTPFVALVKVTKYLTFKDIYKEKMPMSMEVEVKAIYKGKETRKKITVWGDNGILCRPYLSKFKIGNYYVIAFYNGEGGSRGFGSSEKTTDYCISVCGEYWLDANKKNKTAVSSTTEYQTHFNLKELKSKLAIH